MPQFQHFPLENVPPPTVAPELTGKVVNWQNFEKMVMLMADLFVVNLEMKIVETSKEFF